MASGHHGWTEVTTTDRGGSHGQAVVAATAMVAFPLPELLRFFCDASISHAFITQLLLAFAFKWTMNLVHITERVHRIASNSL